MRPITSIAIIAASIGIFFAYTKPVWNGELKISWSFLNHGSNIESLTANLDAYNTALDNVEKMKNKLEALEASRASFSEADYKKLGRVVSSENFNKITGTWPTRFDPIRFSLELKALAAKRGIKISKFDVGSISTDAGQVVPSGTATSSSNLSDNVPVLADNNFMTVEPKEFTFFFSAPYNTILQFVSDLEHNLRIIDIRSMSFSVGKSPVYDVEMRIATYEMKNATEQGR